MFKNFCIALAIVGIVFIGVRATPVSAQSADTIQAQIQKLLEQIQALTAQIQALKQQQLTTGNTVIDPTSYRYRFCQNLNRDLGLGKSGDDVQGMQQYLHDQGYYNGDQTGYFGPITANAVAQWQSSQGLSPVGILGPMSRERIKRWCGENTSGALTASPQSGSAPLTVNFYTKISGFHPSQIIYTIAFGDGSSEAAANCNSPADACIDSGINTHTYASNGTYIATLTMTTKNTCQTTGDTACAEWYSKDQILGSVQISVGNAMKADMLKVYPSASGDAPLTVNFVAGTQLPGPLMADAPGYSIVFGDGQSQQLQCDNRALPTTSADGQAISFPASCTPAPVSHTYTTTGTYTASLVQSGGFCAGQCPQTTLARVILTVGSQPSSCKPINYLAALCSDGTAPQAQHNEEGCVIGYECPVDRFTPPASCKAWNDGCNTCSRTSTSAPAMCTMRACFAAGAGYCSVYFDNPNKSGTPPVISGISGPTSLQLGQQGTWTVNASDPANGSLSYDITWGDEYVPYALNSSGMAAVPSFVQTSTFTHTYNGVGTYTITVLVHNSSGQTAKTSTTVQVTSNTGICTQEYAPVCGRPAPSPCSDATYNSKNAWCWTVGQSPAQRTYDNRCMMNADGATFLYSGECSNSLSGLQVSGSGTMMATITGPDTLTSKINSCVYSYGWYGEGGNGVSIDWGDGTNSIPWSQYQQGQSCVNAQKAHTYSQAGTYSIRATIWHPGPTDGAVTDWTGAASFTASAGQYACTADAMQCADGSWVGRTGPNCQFVCSVSGSYGGDSQCGMGYKWCGTGVYGYSCMYAPNGVCPGVL